MKQHMILGFLILAGFGFSGCYTQFGVIAEPEPAVAYSEPYVFETFSPNYRGRIEYVNPFWCDSWTWRCEYVVPRRYVYDTYSYPPYRYKTSKPKKARQKPQNRPQRVSDRSGVLRPPQERKPVERRTGRSVRSQRGEQTKPTADRTRSRSSGGRSTEKSRPVRERTDKPQSRTRSRK